MVSGKVYGNSAGKGGGFYVSEGTILNTEGVDLYNNTASTYGGAIYNLGTLNAKGTLVHNNKANTSGGGVYSMGAATIENGYYYSNTNSGLSVDGGTTTIKGGYFGFSDYKSDSDYTVSRNTVAQIITGKSGTVNVTGENKTRVVASMSDGESIYTSTEHIAIKNAGVFNIAGNCEKGDFDIYGTGTGINNSGTFNADGAMRITSSAKVGETTIQNRLGVRNTGTFTLNNEDAEISYCGFRGVNNSGTFHLKEGSIHHNSTKFYPETNSYGEEISGGHGGGIVNLGSFDMSGGKIHNNSTKESGGGIITGCTSADDKEFFSSGSFKMSGGEIYSNTAGTHGGGVSVYNRTSSCEITGGKIGGSEDKANIAGDCGGGVYIGDAYSKSTETTGAINITGVAVSYNTANNGGGIYLDRGGSTKISSDDVVLSNNTALNQGGGIHIRNGETRFSQGVNVNNNTAKVGGGVYINSGAKVFLEGCVIEYNKASHTDVAKTSAGGVDNRGELVADGKDGYEVLIQYNISSNTVGGLSSGGTTTLKNVSINNNSASGTGGGIGVSGTLNIEDGARIFANTSNGMGAGILANGSGIINMTGGTVGGESSNDGNISSSSGGGLALLGSSKLNLSGGNIAYNNAKNNGGGINASGTSVTTIIGGKISSNVAKNSGGGVCVDTNASLEATKGEISNNEVQTLNGGGIYNSGTTILNGSEVVVSENTAYKIGGGVYTTSGSTFTATNCKVAENEAETGAGIYLLGEADITGVLVEKNIAGKVGGGISVGAIADGVEINLKNCDIKANELAKITGVEGAGLYFTNTKGVVNVNNCDIHENVATGSGDFAGGVLVRGNVSVVGSRVYDNYASHGAGMLLGSGNFVMKDSEVYNNGILKDENGEVTSTASQGGGIRIAKTDTKPITFENSDIHDNTARDGGGIAVTIAKDVPVNFDNKTIIRNNIAAYRGGGIYVSHTEGYETQFDIKGGKICSNTAVHGGGVNYQDGVLASNIANVEVCCNKATGNRKESGSGGGVYLATETDITITGSDTKIHDNIGEDGGGVAVSGNLEVKNGVQIYNNKVFRSSDVDTSVLAFKDGYKGGYGGGLYLYPTGKEIVLDGANIYNNYSDHQGGGILSQGTTTYIKGNTKIHNNDCPTGGGMFNNGIVVISESAEFYENTATNHAGICNNGNGNITIKGNVKIHNNTAEKNSGGIFNNGNCTLKIEENVEVYENSASTGGGIYAAGKFHLASNAKIHHNTANYGGGITISAIGDKLFEMTGGEVYENTAKYGAGIYFGTNAKNNALSGGSIYKNAASEHGGGIYLSNDTITVNITNGFEVYENTAKKGAGITVILGTLNVDNGVIRNNTASDSGGGIWNKGVVNLTETLVYENEAKASGGGIDVLGTVNTFAKLTVVGGEIRDNFAAMNGGGVHSVYGNVSLDDCVVSGNVSEGVFVSGDKDARGGGGLFVNSGTLDLINCEISSNSAVNNGGGFYTLAKTTIENIEVFNNTAGNLGGGIAVHDAGLVNVGEHIVVHNNTASSGGGIYNTGEWYEDEDFTQETGVKVYENTATGGAIFNQKTYVSHNAEIYDNTGYGVKNERQMTIYDALVHNNSNSGIQCATNSVLAIEDSKIYSNGASSEGAGVYCTSTAKTTTITDCEIYDNVATYAGGGIRAYGTQVDVIGGKIYNNSAKSNGGAIVVGSPNCNLYGVEIFDNGKEKEYTKADGTKATISTVNGGGVYVTSNGVLNVDERTELLGSVPTKVYNHTASGAGAGIYNLGTLNVKSGMIYNNGVTNDGENGVGGGICNMGEKSKLNVTGGEIFENVAPRGAGIYVDILSQESFISDAKIHHNTYPIGGVGMGVYTLTTAGLTIRDSEVYSNSSDSDLDSETEWKQRSSGGGIANGGVLTIESTKTAGLLDASPAMKIYDNHVSSGGGGISNHTNGTVTIRGGEIYGNSAISFVPDKNGIVKGSGGGGGIANNNTLIVESGETNGTEVLIHNNLSGNAGSGIFNAGGTKTYLKVTGSKIYDNGKLKTTVDGVTKEYIGICGGGIYSAGKFEVEDAEIYNNYVTGSGGGIGVEGTYGDFNSTVTNCIIRDNYAGVQGGGIGGGVGNGSFTVKGGEVYNNSSISGGGIINSGNTKLDGVKVYNNYATDGAGVYAWSGVFEMIDTEVYENGSVDTTNGGGIYIRKNDTQPVTITNCLIKDNTAKRGGGVNVSRTKDATVNIVGTEIDNNKAYVGGGIYLYADAGEITVKDGSVISNNTTTRTTNYDPHGGGVFVAKGTTVNLNNSEVSNNSSEAYGGGAWVEGTLNLNGKNTKVDNNDAQTGGGVFIQSNGTVNMNNGIISDNSSTASAGGVWVHQNSNFNMSGGSIESNTAGTNGNGVYITGLGTFSMTGGSISGNTKTLGDKKGVYVAGATEEKVGTFEMSGDAVVANDNIVFLEKFAYISVPEEFTNDKNIRAHIDGAEMVTGRVVAKHTPEPVQATDKNGNPVVDEEGNPVYEENAFGTVALYHDAENPVMVEQYFAVNGKMLRAGNQGASKYTKENNIVNQDVFITEGYSITFDMNVPLEESLVSSEVTHTIDGVGEWTFPDGLSNRYVNENVYIKYWYEDISVENEFSRGYAEADFASFSDWNTESDGSGDIFDPDSVIEIEGSVNENITYYAQWLTQLIDINYLGNGATLGNDFTEKDVDATQDEYTLDDGIVNGKEEQNATGIDEDGKPVFERVEEVREVVTDENGDPVIDAETGEEVTVVTDTKLFSFEGWSFAERPNSENPVMDFNTNVEMREITSRLNSPNNRSLFAMFNLRNVEQADGEHENSYANIYAAWDQYPKIYAVDRYFTLEEAQAGKITLDELMNTEYTFACDGFDKENKPIYLLDEDGNFVRDENDDFVTLWEGQNTNFYDSNEVQATDKDGNLLFDDKGDPVMVDEYIRDDAESFIILDYAAEDFTSLKASAAKTLTFCAVDRAGNMTVKTITVYVTDNSDADASFFSRFISERYFKDAEGNFVLEENGGFNEKSNWVTKVDYVALLESVFANKKDEDTGKWDEVYEIWTWDVESIKEAKQFVEDEGLGNVEQDDALARFRTKFGPVKIN
ncbi:MAG: right-handed parallel beta-helix repeat-containing protein [Acutalibacteraceae bacterium]|nr:right-handed parallel beta-helix repeat-containing protein [Acutalibacteraceae bacterium]